MRMFKGLKKKNQSEGPTGSSINIAWSKIFLGLSLALVVVLIIGYGYFKCKNIYDKVSTNWSEIMFAYEKPQLVETMRMEYERRQAELEADFTKREKTSEEKLIDELVGQIQQPTPSQRLK